MLSCSSQCFEREQRVVNSQLFSKGALQFVSSSAEVMLTEVMLPYASAHI